MRLAVIGLLVGTLLVAAGCGGSETAGQSGFGAVGGNEPAPQSEGGADQEFLNVRAVVQALDKHELTRQVLRPTNPYVTQQGGVQLTPVIQAYDFRNYRIDSGTPVAGVFTSEYIIEIYVYTINKSEIPDQVAAYQSDENLVHGEGNIILVLNTTDQSVLDAIIDDLRDGQDK